MRKPHSTDKYLTLWESTVGAATGFMDAVRCEKKVRQVFLSMVGVAIVCVAAGVGRLQVLVVVFAWVLALICEMFNTALEKALDYACDREYHVLIREGKDYASACTFVSIVFAAGSTLFVLADRHLF